MFTKIIPIFLLAAMTMFFPSTSVDASVHLPSIWENGYIQDGDTVETDSHQLIGAFTVHSDQYLSLKNSKLRINIKGVRGDGKYFSDVTVVSSDGLVTTGTINHRGVVVFKDKVIVSPGTHDYFVYANISDQLSTGTEVRVVLKKARIKIGGSRISLPARTNFFLQKLIIK